VTGRNLPRPLKAGDRIRIISPAGPVDPNRLMSGIDILKSWEYEVDLAPHALAKNGFLAGTDADRLNDLHDALLDKEVDGLICSRGGYGVLRLFDAIDWSELASTETKCFVGFSDISAFQLALCWKCGWVTYSGPQAAMGLSGGVNERSLRHLKGMIDGSYRFLCWNNDVEIDLQSIRGTGAKGVLVPCNLSMLNALLGTDYMPDLKGALLCIEDISEPPYRVDRMLWQLRHSRKAENLSALIIGEFTFEDKSIVDSVTESAIHHFADTEFPIWRGLPYGHVDDRLTLPVGVDVELDDHGGLDIV